MNFFSSEPKQFTGENCSMKIQLALNRLKLRKKKKAEMAEGMKREIASLIQQNKQEQARVKTMALIHDDYMMEIMTITELYLERINLRMEVISAQISIPLDIAEQIYGIVYIAPYLDNINEALLIRDMFVQKYGKNLSTEGVENKCISSKVLDRLSRASPSESLIEFYLGTIAMHYSIPWEPTGKTEVTHELFDMLLLEEEIDESQFRSKDESEAASKSAVEKKESRNLPADALDLELSLPDTATTSNENRTEGMLMRDKNGNLWVVESEKAPPIYIPKCDDATLIGTKVAIVLDQRKDGKRSGKLFSPAQQQAQQQQLLQQRLLEEQRQLDLQRQQHLKQEQQQRDLIKQQQLQEQMRALEQQRQFDLQKQQQQQQQQQSVNASGDLTCVLMKDKMGHYWAQRKDAVLANSAQYVFVHPNDLNGATEGESVRVRLHERADGKLSGFIVAGPPVQAQSQPLPAPIALSHSVTPVEQPSKAKTVNSLVEGMVLTDLHSNNWLVPLTYSKEKYLEDGSVISDEEDNIFISPGVKPVESGDHVVVRLVQNSSYGANFFVGQVEHVLKKSEFLMRQVLGVVVFDNEGDFYTIESAQNEFKDVVISFEDLNGSEEGDLVILEVTKKKSDLDGSTDSGWTGKTIKIIEKHSVEFTSRLSITNKQFSNYPHAPLSSDVNSIVGWVQNPHAKRNEMNKILIPAHELNGSRDGDMVRVIVTQKDGKIRGRVVCVLDNNVNDNSGSSSLNGSDQASLFPSTPTNIQEIQQRYKEITNFAECANISELLNPIAVILGSESISYGFIEESDEDIKLFTEASVIGTTVYFNTSKLHSILPTANLHAEYYGTECLGKSSVLQLNYPIVDGEITNFNEFSALLNWIVVTKLQSQPTRHPFIFIDSSASNVETLKALFEKLHLPLLSVVPEWRSLFRNFNIDSGIYLSISGTSTTVVPIYQGNMLPFAMIKESVGGENVTENLSTLLKLEGVMKHENLPLSVIRKLKETHAEVIVASSEIDGSIAYELPDGQIMNFPRRLCAQACEVLFAPQSSYSSDAPACLLVEMCTRLMRSCPQEMREVISKNLILSGGTTFIKGFKERLAGEFQSAVSNQSSLFLAAPAILSTPDLPSTRLAVVHGALQLCESKSVVWYENDILVK